MPACGPYMDAPEGVSEQRMREFEIDSAKLRVMEERIDKEPMLRAGLGMDPTKTQKAAFVFADWARRRVRINPLDPNQELTSADINFLFAEMIRVMDVMRNMKKWGDGTTAYAKLNKLLFLPADHFRKNIIGGEDFFHETQITRAQADGMRSRQNTEIHSIGKQFKMLTGVASRAINKYVTPLEDAVSEARDRIEAMKEAGASEAEMKDAQVSLENARADLNDAYDGKVKGNQELGDAIRLQRALVLAMEGLREVTDKNTGKKHIEKLPLEVMDIDEYEAEVKLFNPDANIATDKKGKPLALGERVRVKKKVIPPRALKAALGKVAGGFKEGSIAAGIVDQVRDYLEGFRELARQSVEMEKQNWIIELTRGPAQMNAKDAMDFVEEQVSFTEEDLYFPRVALGKMNTAIRRRNEARLVDNPAEFLKQLGPIKEGSGVLRHVTNPHMMKRKYAGPRSDTSYNMMGVLQGYANDMISYWHDNKITLEAHNHLERVQQAWRETKDKSGKEWMEGYLDGLDDYVKTFVENSKGRHTSGKLAEVSKILTAWKVGLTMGFLNPSTPLLNFAEGQALLLTRSGQHYLYNAEKQNLYRQIQPIIDKEYTKVHGEELLQQESMPATKGLLYEMDSAGHYRRVEQDTALLALQRTRRAVTDVAKASIVAQRAVENTNRHRAFRTGALMEYEYLLKYRPLFRQMEWKDVQSTINAKAYGLKESDFPSPGSGGADAIRTTAWNKFIRNRIIKAGYEMVYQTQWNYNMVARHFFEGNPIGKMAMMFQHYPLSWVASLRRNFDILNSIRRAGSGEGIEGGAGHRAGIKAMFARDTRSKELGLFTNQEMMFALISGGILLGTNALRMGTGVVLGQLWQHPLLETAQDMVKYTQNSFSGENEKNKALFWGAGAAQQFTGPLFGDLMDAVSLAGLKLGIEDGDMPRWTADVLRGTVGFRPNEVLLTKFGTRKYNSAWDVMYETFLMGGMSVAPKAMRIAKNIPNIGENYMGKPATLQDFSYQLLRAAGVRDEKASEKFVEGQLGKTRK